MEVCWRCAYSKAFFFHIWLSCGEIAKFWKLIKIELRKILGIHLLYDPFFFFYRASVDRRAFLNLKLLMQML